MAIPGLDSEKCRQRNRIAASAKYGVESTPVLLGRVKSDQTPNDGIVMASVGYMPKDIDEHLDWIRAVQVSGATPVTAEDVYVHEVIAASNVFIPDRYAFNAPSTLRNIAIDAISGVAFMNSHRTGGLSHPSELPYGRTHAGIYEQFIDDDGNEVHLARIAFYMARGVFPNGANGPSTDNLNTMINTGMLFDVSVGLWEGTNGQAICNVCELDLFGGECPHYPGTDFEMTLEEKERELRRGIPNGFASYRLENYRLSETSGVYDGAVPGAGFRKVQQSLTSLPDAVVQQAIAAYAPLLQGSSQLQEIADKFGISLTGDEMDVSKIRNKFAQVGRDVAALPGRKGTVTPQKLDAARAIAAADERVAQQVNGTTAQEQEGGETPPVVDSKNNVPQVVGDISQDDGTVLPPANVGSTDDPNQVNPSGQFPASHEANVNDNPQPEPATVTGSEDALTVPDPESQPEEYQEYVEGVQDETGETPGVVPPDVNGGGNANRTDTFGAQTATVPSVALGAYAPVAIPDPVADYLKARGITSVEQARQMEAKATDGEAFRRELADQYATQRNRLFGAGTMNVNQAVSLTAGWSVEQIKQETALYKAQADRILSPDVQRQTVAPGRRTEVSNSVELLAAEAARQAQASNPNYREEAKRVVKQALSNPAGRLPKGDFSHLDAVEE